MRRSMRSRQKIFGHHELTNLGLQPSDFDSPLGIETFVIDLQCLDSTAHELVGPLSILALREAVLAGRFGDRDLTFEIFKNNRSFTLSRPAFELFRLRRLLLLLLAHAT